MTVVPIIRAVAPSPPSPATGPSLGPESMNSVLGKVRPILEAFTADDESLSLADLVRRTGVAKATVHRLCQELVVWGLLERAGCDYRLGLRLFEIGQRVHRQRILREVAQPYMEDLLLATRETIHFAIHDGLDVVYLEKILPHRGLSEESRVAGRLPLYCTATGKAILAFSPAALFGEVVRNGLKPFTRHTITSPGRLRGQLERIREGGVATEAEEVRLGYMSMAVPVFGRQDTLAGALSITAPTYRVDAAAHASALRTAGLGISRSLRSAL
ncbi:IclR family transcriptional regulator [Streptomyces sp. NPDC002677]|uniref:IclR family transcriptional regulator n=1 Tax=Streptomyces sp. NPDC002677 TaxID=3154774 RepID=UPI003328B181